MDPIKVDFSKKGGPKEIVIPPDKAALKIVLSVLCSLVTAVIAFYIMLPPLNFKAYEFYGFLAIIIAFLSPFATFLASIPSCVMGGVCISLYGFIAVSGLKMIQKVDLEDNRNLFVVSVILIAGIGGLTISFGKVTITSIACALILGILTNVVLGNREKNKKAE